METRPQSIVTFERFYGAAFALGLVNTMLSWSATQATISVSPMAASYGSWFLPVSAAIGFAITLSLWYFIARRGSAVAKWIATVFVALGVFGAVLSLFTGRYPTGIGGVIGVVTTALQLIAITFLFRPDTKMWFGEKTVDAAA